MAFKTDDREIIKELRTFLTETSNYMSKIYKRTKEEEEFASGNQFNSNDDRILGDKGARVTLNLIGKHENSIVNPFLNHPYGIGVSSKIKAGMEKALYLTSLLKGIEYKCNAVDSYGSALRSAVRTGYGYVYVTTEYANSKSFDQDIIIESVLNSRCVAFDITSKKLDGSDAEKAAFIDYEDEVKAKALHGDSITNESKYSLNGLATSYDIPPDAIPKVTFFKKHYTSKKFYKLTDGRVGYESEFTKSELKDALSREIKAVTIKVYTIIGNKVVNETELPISYIPIVPFYGKKVTLENKNQYVGIVYDSKSAQQLVNYNASKMAERIARTPKNQWTAPEGSIVGDPHWANADTGLYSILTFREKDEEGNPISGRPMLQQSNVDISDVLAAKANFEQTLADIIGTPRDGIQGAGFTTQSATEALIEQNSVENNNSHFYYNAKSSIKHIGRICTELVTKYYDTKREQIIIDAQGKPQRIIVDISEMAIEPADYDIELTAGPSEATTKQQNIKMLVGLGSMLPENQKIFIGPMVAKNLQMEGSDELATRLEMAIPPEFKQSGPQGDPKALEQLQMADAAIAKQQEVQGAMAEQLSAKDMELQQSYQYITELQSYIASNEKKIQADILMNTQDNEVDIEIERMKLQNSNAQLGAKIMADAEKETVKQQSALDAIIIKTQSSAPVPKPSFTRYS